MVPGGTSTLTPDDFSHLRPHFRQIKCLLDDAVRNSRRGVNVLLYGPPGTGKSELSRTLAGDLDVHWFEVSTCDIDDVPLDARARLSGAATAQFLLEGRRALLCLVEIDAILNAGIAFFGQPTTAESSKAWFNQPLENTAVPTVCHAYRTHPMEPPFFPRF